MVTCSYDFRPDKQVRGGVVLPLCSFLLLESSTWVHLPVGVSKISICNKGLLRCAQLIHLPSSPLYQSRHNLFAKRRQTPASNAVQKLHWAIYGMLHAFAGNNIILPHGTGRL